MSHNFPCSPQGGKMSQLNPTCCIGKTIIGGIYIHPQKVHLDCISGPCVWCANLDQITYCFHVIYCGML